MTLNFPVPPSSTFATDRRPLLWSLWAGVGRAARAGSSRRMCRLSSQFSVERCDDSVLWRVCY